MAKRLEGGNKRYLLDRPRVEDVEHQRCFRREKQRSFSSRVGSHDSQAHTESNSFSNTFCTDALPCLRQVNAVWHRISFKYSFVFYRTRWKVCLMVLGIIAIVSGLRPIWTLTFKVDLTWMDSYGVWTTFSHHAKSCSRGTHHAQNW